MLTLTRREGEIIKIGHDCVVVVRRIKGREVRIGVEAPREVRVVRGELDDGKEGDR